MNEDFDIILGDLKKAGIETVTIEYNGSGDEGWIEEIKAEPLAPGTGLDYELEGDLKELGYAILEKHHAGWEINEGSQGHITIYVPASKYLVHHGENEIQTTYFDTEVSV